MMTNNAPPQTEMNIDERTGLRFNPNACRNVGNEMKSNNREHMTSCEVKQSCLTQRQTGLESLQIII